MQRVLLAIILAVCSATAIAKPEFKRFYGKETVFEGRGGEMETIEGVEFWSNGEPPRTFELLGFIEDRRHKTGLLGAVRMSGLKKDVAKLAKQSGGDAVVLVAANADTVGFVGTSRATATSTGNSATAYGSSMSAGVQKQNTRFAVVRYVAATEAPAEPSESARDGSDAEVPQ